MAALVSLSAGGAITGFSFAPKAAADFSSPTSLPLNLVALRQSVQAPQPDRVAPSHDAMLRAAIVHVADYYLRMAQTKPPAEMEAIIWQHDSLDGVDHGESCAAFASLTLELGAQVVGLQSWVTGGGSYPWPLHTWADVRVDANPASLGITSIQQDAQAHHRWHPLGDGYQPLPGDWVLFDGHVEVVTKDAGGVLQTVGGDSLPNFSVNAHEYPGPLSRAGVAGFVNNGSLPGPDQASGAQGQAPAGGQHAASEPSGAGSGGGAALPSGAGSAGSAGSARQPSRDRRRGGNDASAASGELAAIPGTGTAQAARGLADPAIPGLVPAQRTGPADHEKAAAVQKAAQEGKRARVAPGGAAIPGFATDGPPSHQGTAYRRHHPSPVRAPVSETQAQQAFISEVAPGAVAAQRRYGVPAAVTIAQAIDESGWGQSELASQDHNLFGIKGTGPAGSVPLPTQEYVNGQPVNTSASFRVYNNVAESIDDHGRLLARSGYYQQAMADRQHPDKFAAALTGVYATDPNYGASLISLMRRYELYRYGAAGQAQQAHSPAVPAPGSATIPGVGAAPSAPPERTGSAAGPAAGRQPTRKRKPEPTRPASPQPSRTVSPQPTGTAGPQPTRTVSPQPTGTASPQPTRTASPQPTGTGSPPPAGTASPQPTRTAGPRSSATDSPQPAASAQPAATDSPHPTPADSSGATPAATPSRSGSAPAATPSVSRAQADIPGVTTQSEAESPITSAVRFGPAAPFVPVAWSAPARPAPARPAPARATPARSAPARPEPRVRSVPAARTAAAQRSSPAPARATLVSARRYQPQIPRSVLNSFVETAKGPLVGEESFYRDVASFHGISWELLAACDWMQCDARPKRSPVYGEKLGTVNADGTVYTSKSAALARCADDLVTLARAVYRIDLTRGATLSVRDLANAFAAFRWGRALKDRDFSAMKFPYSVAGLSENHLTMRWPDFAPRNSGDRPGGRFHRKFGAVPIVLSLDYPATV